MNNFWEETKQMYCQLFEKPRMSDKLLQKPPFKYIFDIILETSKQTGYCQGLYENYELVSDYYDTRERKQIFLERIIDFTERVLDEKIAAQPQKIIHGLEPQNTNLMLQAIFRAAMKDTTQWKNVEFKQLQIQHEYQQKRQQELLDLLQDLEQLINNEQFKQIYTDSFYQKLNDEINYTKDQLQQKKIPDLKFIQEKIETFKKKQSTMIDFIKNNIE